MAPDLSNNTTWPSTCVARRLPNARRLHGPLPSATEARSVNLSLPASAHLLIEPPELSPDCPTKTFPPSTTAGADQPVSATESRSVANAPSYAHASRNWPELL